MSRVCEQLPEGYRLIQEVDLQKNKKLALWLNLSALAVGLALGWIGHRMVPITKLFDFSQGMGMYFLRFFGLMVAMIAYIVLHEVVHGIVMKAFGARKVRYGFTGLYAFAGTDAYFDKFSYIVVALAPVVVWGIVLAVVNAFVPATWFWVVYLTQITNLSGAAGDIYVTAKFSKLPADLLVHDHGTGMKVYSKM